MRTLSPKRPRSMTDAETLDHFTPGNVIQLDYWRTFDRVIEFRGDVAGNWSVVVENVILVNGVWIANERPRVHSTRPRTCDRVVLHA